MVWHVDRRRGEEEIERREGKKGGRGGELGKENQLGLYLESGYSCKHRGLGQARPKHGTVSRLSRREGNWETGG